MKKKSLLFIENGFGFGGAVICLSNVLSVINRNEFNLFVITTHNDSTTIKIFEKLGVNYKYIRIIHRPKIFSSIIDISARFGKAIKFLVIILLTIVEVILNLPFLVKSIFFAHSNKIDMIISNNLININNVMVAKLYRKPYLIHIRGNQSYSILSKWLIKHVSIFVVMSNFLKFELLKMGADINKIYLVYDGIDLPKISVQFNSQDLIGENKNIWKRRNVGLFGCLVAWKGQDVFLKAIKLLILERRISDCSFFIIGDVPNSNSNLKLELMNLAKSLEIDQHVHFLGHQNEVIALMNKMDVVVHASIEPEPFGMVIIEAMAIGKPVISTNIGGPLDIIENGINGILIDPNQPSILADTIIDLLSDERKRISIGNAAKESISTRFSFSNYTQLESIYNDTIMKKI